MASDLAPVLAIAGLILRSGADAAAADPLTTVGAWADASCPVQLNLAFLLSSDNEPQDDLIATELARAHDVCPGDPTPLWLLGHLAVVEVAS